MNRIINGSSNEGKKQAERFQPKVIERGSRLTNIDLRQQTTSQNYRQLHRITDNFTESQTSRQLANTSPN
jgi:hypothetical protein